MLSPEQLDLFQQQGFLALERLIDTELLDRLESEYSAALDAQIDWWRSEGKFDAVAEGCFFDKLLAVNAAGLDWFQPLDITLPMGEITADTPFHMGPAVFDLLTYGPLLDAAESLIGGEMAITPIQHVRIKPPRKNLSETEDRAMVDVTAWHQDRGVVHEEADTTLMVTAWVAVTDATCENGCLTVIPGEVNDSLLTHCPEGQTHIPDSVLDKSGAVPIEIPRGSVLLLHPSTPHASLPNISDGFRWSFDLRFHRLGDPSGRSHFPSFVARSQAEAPVANWQEMRDTWLEARDRLAQQEEIPLHRWQSDASVCA